MSDADQNADNDNDKEQKLASLKGNGARGTWAVLIVIAVVFTVARFVMKATAE